MAVSGLKDVATGQIMLSIVMIMVQLTVTQNLTGYTNIIMLKKQKSIFRWNLKRALLEHTENPSFAMLQFIQCFIYTLV